MDVDLSGKFHDHGLVEEFSKKLRAEREKYNDFQLFFFFAFY